MIVDTLYELGLLFFFDTLCELGLLFYVDTLRALGFLIVNDALVNFGFPLNGWLTESLWVTPLHWYAGSPRISLSGGRTCGYWTTNHPWHVDTCWVCSISI